MTKRTDAPAPDLAELRRRNAAFAALLDPVVDRLRELQAQRTELLALDSRAASAAEAAMGHEEWVREGEERFSAESGRQVGAAALARVVDELAELEMPEAAAKALDEHHEAASRSTGWIPLSTDEDIAAAIEEGRHEALTDGAREARRGIVEAFQSGVEAFEAARGAYVLSDLDDESEEYEAALAKALLILTTAAEEALERLEQREGAAQ